jgi:alpha-pyrone synthase
MTTAYLNRIAGAVPPHDVHAAFLHFAESLLVDDQCRTALFRRMARWAGIEHRYSLLSPADDPEGTTLDTAGLYVRGTFPTTAGHVARLVEIG